MARIAGRNLPKEKRVVIALTYIYGIGIPRAKKILSQIGIDENTKVENLTEDEVNKLRASVEQFKIEGDLKREIMQHVKRLKEIHCFRGSRHAKGLPVRGQTTKTNSRTVRGNVRNTAGSGKRALTKT